MDLKKFATDASSLFNRAKQVSAYITNNKYNGFVMFFSGFLSVAFGCTTFVCS